MADFEDNARRPSGALGRPQGVRAYQNNSEVAAQLDAVTPNSDGWSNYLVEVKVEAPGSYYFRLQWTNKTCDWTPGEAV
jgi:hypothetical protein